ncbi:MAG: tetratricopeptide repeat protein [Planctomycetes bacterium]|nr:tetratricopeptide repeat protein [Planctomycetota bacterium]
MAKEGPLFAVPVLLGLHDLFLRPGEKGLLGRCRRAAPRWIALAAIGVLHLLLRLAVLGSLSPRFTAINRLDNPLLFEAAPVRIANALRVMAHGLRLLLWPHPLSADYSLEEIPVVPDLGSPGAIGAFLLFAALAVGAGLLLARGRTAGFALAFLLAPWLPSSNLLFGAGTIFGERLLYLPSVGLCLLAATLVPAPGRRSRAVAAVACAALVLLGIARTNTRLGDWKDNLRLWEVTATRDAPGSARAHGAHAVHLLEAGRREEALRGLERTLEIFPGYYHVHGKMAEIRRQEGDLRGAAEEMLRALRGQIRFHGREAPDADAFLYVILRDYEQVPDGMKEAARQFEALLAEGFDIPLLRAYLGEALAAAGEIAASEEQYRRAFEGPHPPVARASHAMALFRQGRHDEALREAAVIRPDASTLARQRKRLVTGQIARARGAAQEAVEAFDEILADEEIDPLITHQARFARGMAGSDLAFALRNLRPEEALERLVRARADLEAALGRTDPTGPVAAAGVGRLVSILSVLGELDAAESVLRRGIGAQPQTESLRLLLVGLLAGRGRLAAARAEIAPLRERAPQQPSLLLLEGELLLSSGDAEGAKERASRAAELAPSSQRGARALRARAEVASGNVAAGLALLEQVAAERPTDATVAGWLGLALVDAGRTAEARGALSRAVELGIEEAAVFDALARLHGFNEPRDLPSATRLSDQALALAPGDPRYLHTRARLHLASGEKESARAALDRALPALGDYSPAVGAQVRSLLEQAGR